MKKLAAIILTSLALVGCDDKPIHKAPAVDLNQVSNVCSNMVKTYIQKTAESVDLDMDSKVRFIRYEGLDHLIERQCRLTSMQVRNENEPEVRRKLGDDLAKDVQEFASDNYSASRYTFVNNTVKMAEIYASKLAQANDKYELAIWIDKIKEVK